MHVATGSINAVGPLVEVIVKVPLCVAKVQHAQGLPVKPQVREWALIDTGSTGSLVHRDIILSLGLTVRDHAWLGSPTSGASPVLAKRFLIGLAIWTNPSPHLIDPLLVMAIDLSNRPFKVVLGMDVLKDGLFTLDGKNGVYSLEF